MAKQTKTQQSAKNPHPPLSAEWLYDEIMASIEPDLLTKNIPLLEERYKGETEEQKKMRQEHYQVAFLIFDRVAADLEKEMKADVTLWKKQMAALANAEISVEEQSQLTQLEDSINSHQS
ncbi:hypothetical protein A3D88_03030 [Candidatus Peribacteria bacterium RIFCSPHIGHO2_02_FULL_52_16]|nr:MAG: hypothetical protein A2706_06095 [Candidatus Peribacteria bacterium RIFCSPHIGHO2_01_FULL_51_35]OGJ60654.1 MAG: hypothetical protein A3D88_03030 [Candidatus Peribacteria bacterium RIFCSPHIGHO2_02_FULL_52_16]